MRWITGNVHTGVNFVEKVESCPMIKFVRVTYVRPVADFGVGSSAEYHTAIYSPPSGFNYRTFLPAPVKVGMCSGSPVYETVSSTCERSKIWLRCVGALRFSLTFITMILRQLERVGWLVGWCLTALSAQKGYSMPSQSAMICVKVKVKVRTLVIAPLT